MKKKKKKPKNKLTFNKICDDLEAVFDGAAQKGVRQGLMFSEGR